MSAKDDETKKQASAEGEDSAEANAQAEAAEGGEASTAAEADSKPEAAKDATSPARAKAADDEPTEVDAKPRDEDAGEGETDDEDEKQATSKSTPPPKADPPKKVARAVSERPVRHEPKAAHGGHDEHHGDAHYVQIWAILVALLVASVVGPMLGHPVITLITAFGIAIVKAYMVAKNFMHLNVEKKYVAYVLLTMVAFMFLFFAGVAPDVMKHKGHNWRNEAAEQETKRALEAAKTSGHHGH